jgi:SPX domain protein involved in polyphosphate accumulation
MESLRLERKFVPEGMDMHKLERVIRSNSCMFFKVFPAQYVNNLYFDTPDLDLFAESVEGISQRKKYRLRWYGDLQPADPWPVRWEIKGRENIFNHKQVYALQGFDLQELKGDLLTKQLFAHEDLPSAQKHPIRFLRPVLFNRYHREYYLSGDRRYRVTIDSDVEYYSADGKAVAPLCFDRESRNVGAIVEMKYPPENAEDAPRIAAEFPFRLTKNSKYTNGVVLLKRCCFL